MSNQDLVRSTREARPGVSREKDRELVLAILDGSIPAWHEFVDSYADLILATVRRVLRGNEDDIRTTFVTVLARLYQGQLSRYEGRASLSTWLVLVSRNLAFDHLRKRLGRREMPANLAQLGEPDRQIFRWHHWEGLDVAAIRERLALAGNACSVTDVLAAFDRIESRLSHHVLRRLEYDVEATRVGAVSGRFLEFLDDYREHVRLWREESAPDAQLVAEQERARLARVRRLLDELPQEERTVLSLRFEGGHTANEISDEMQLGGGRRAYTLIERAVRRLRAWWELGRYDDTRPTGIAACPPSNEDGGWVKSSQKPVAGRVIGLDGERQA